MKLGIIDYGSGNLHSVEHALVHAAAEIKGASSVERVTTAAELGMCDQIVLPGVGHFADCRNGLMAVDGMVEALRDAVMIRGRPFLGICVGMQLLADEGYEGQVTEGLGWIAGHVRPLPRTSQLDGAPDLKIPHMGWNTLHVKTEHPVLAGLDEAAQVYFVHSYFFETTSPDMVIATTDYGIAVPAAVGRDNLLGTQFHPEKSQQVGQQILRQFLSWRP